MSSTILPTLTNVAAERQAATVADARASSQAARNWHAVLEQAGDQCFGGWFQGPTDQPDAGASAGAAPLPASSMSLLAARSHFAPTRANAAADTDFGRGSGSAGQSGAAVNASTARVRASTRNVAPTPTAHTGADRLDNVPAAALAAAAPGSVEPLANGAPVLGLVGGRAASLATMLQSFLQIPVAAAGDVASFKPVVDAALATPRPSLIVRATPGGSDASDEQATIDAPRATNRDAEVAAGAKRETLRLHAEWTDAGVRIWLGADLGAMPDLSTLTAQLQRWLSGQGMSLLGLVCNGREVIGASKEDRPDTVPRLAHRGETAILPSDFSFLYSGETK